MRFKLTRRLRTNLPLYSFLALTVLTVQATKPAVKTVKTCPQVKIETERLPDLNVPRTSHNTLFLNGEVIVIGGHTSGFVPTGTAEYYRDGKWHLMEMVYDHDQGFSIPMKSGKVMIAGGHDQHLGIGHIFAVELYDPVSHSFEGYGCLDKKRCFAECLEMDSGRIIISGNWYHDDGIEHYNGSNLFSNIKDLPVVRSVPYILRTSKDNAVIFSSCDGKGNPFDTITIDRLQGESFSIPLFKTWRPLYNLIQNHSQDAFIGDESKGNYAYLIPVFNDKGQLAIVKTEGEKFSLLPTDSPVPMRSSFGRINYFSYVVVDRKAGKAYIIGNGEGKGDNRLYILSIGYTTAPASLTLYYSAPLPEVMVTMPVLTSDGDLILAGGVDSKDPNNFKPYATTLLLHVGTTTCGIPATTQIWLWGVLVALIMLAIISITGWFCQRKKKQKDVETLVDSIDNNTHSDIDSEENLMQRISHLMEEKQLFLNAELKLTDLADAMKVSTRVVSDCIKNHCDSSFAHFVNNYRIEYVKQQLRRHPDKKITTVGMDSGFANETSFYRTFKAFTGMTPKEWVTQNIDKIN